MSDNLCNKSIIKSEDDAATIEDIANFSYNQLKDCLDFLEALYCNCSGDCGERNHQLALIAAFALEDRLEEIIADFDGFNVLVDELCDDGVITMIITEVEGRVKRVIAMILVKFHGKILTSAILSMKLLRNAVAHRISVDDLDPSSTKDEAQELLLKLYH